MTSPVVGNAHERDSDAARPLRVVLAAGGTGGHLMPALATAEAIERQTAAEFLLVGGTRESERRLRGLVPYPVREVEAGTLARTGWLGRFRTLAGLPRTVSKARLLLREFGPDLVIASGSYASGPTGAAAALRRIPLLLLEQNAHPGLTNRLLYPFCAKAAVSFESTVEHWGHKAVFTGNPIRGSLPAASSRDGRPLPSPTRDHVRLLILGGSQGALGLNTMIEMALPRLAAAEVGLSVTHQTGAADVERLEQAYRSHGIPAIVTPFIKNIGDAYARADLVCARAGATTIAELAYVGLGSILVPFPHAAARHQDANAAALEAAGAARVVHEGDSGAPLAAAILELASDPQLLSRMQAAAAACGQNDAAGTVARLSLRLAGREPGETAELSIRTVPTPASANDAERGAEAARPQGRSPQMEL